MSIEHRHKITVSGLQVEIVRKDIKNLHLGVYPPAGRVRVAAPMGVSNEAVRLAVVGKLGWIKRQRTRFELQPRQSEREIVSGESHYFSGQRYRLRLCATDGPAKVALANNSTMDLHVRPDARFEARQKVLVNWYREQLKDAVHPLLKKWQERLGVQVSNWGIKKMKTKWGTCNPDTRRILMNLELAKKPPACLEYVIVHELLHLLVRNHDDRFLAAMNTHLPRWRTLRAELNSQPLAHEEWREC